MSNTVMLEKSVLGTMLIHNYLINDTGLTEKYFMNAYHKVIYRIMRQLSLKNQPVDAVTLMSEGSGQLQDLNYIMDLEIYQNIEKFDSYVELLTEANNKRETNNILQVSLSEGWELDRIIAELNNIEMKIDNDAKTAYEMALEIGNLPFQEAANRKGVQTGLKKWDLITGGLIDGELIIVAARPSIGKTAFMLQQVVGTQKHNQNVLALIFSLEMSDASLSKRFICSLGAINQNYLKAPEKLTDGKKEAWLRAVGEYSEMNINLYDKPAQTMAEIRSKVRKAVRENPEMKVVVFIDYLTLIAAADKKANSHVQVSQITRDLKNMAREFDIPVICLAQLNRSVEQRQDKRPMLSDLRESGSIEQDADIVAMLYRDSYYDINKKEDKTLEVIIAKNRSGETGTLFAEYNRAIGVIKDA